MSNIIKTVIKSDGSREAFDPIKLNKWASFATNNEVDWSDIVLSAVSNLHDECTTQEMHQAMIDVCLDRRSEKHLRVAGRLLVGIVYKQAFGGFNKIPTLFEFYSRMKSMNLWDTMDYTEDEIDYLDTQINHGKDITYNYTSLRSMVDKYLIKDRVKNVVLESPQFMFMGMAMQNMENEHKYVRLERVVSLYNHLSDMKINAPTPMLVNMRTPQRSYASCSVAMADDDIESLSANDHISYKMTCASAGIGTYIRTRSKGDGVKNNTVIHRGKLPYYRVQEAMVSANMQACYSDDTLIRVKDGYKLIKDVTEDDLVANYKDGKITYSKPTATQEYDNPSGYLYRFEIEDNFIDVTGNHRMVLSDGEIIKAENIKSPVEMIVTGYNGEVQRTITVQPPKPIEYDRNVYCVTVDTGIVLVRKEEALVSLVCGNSRGGSATVYYDILDPEIDAITRLKNPMTVEADRIRGLDYSVNVHRYFDEQVAKNRDWMLVSYADAPKLYELMHSDDHEGFVEEYHRVLNDKSIKKEIKKARDLIFNILTESAETGRMYIHYVDEANRHTPFTDVIHSSNLCVAPETLILTSEGHKRISDLKDQEVDVWNGEEWSTTTVRQTGVNQQLIKVKLSNGVELECTPYHKFYIQTSYHGKPIEKEARELEVGDSLIKYNLEAIDTGEEWEYAYINGFYTGDGTEFSVGDGRFTEPKSWNGGATRTQREYEKGVILEDRFFVPDVKYSINSRLNWLAGYMDSDGSIYKNGSNRQLVGSSINKEFLLNVKLMLQTLGIDSKVTIQRHAGKKLLPLNDGSGELDYYDCQDSYRIIITSNGLYQLVKMGFDKMVNRLDLSDVEKPQRNASQFIKVVDVVDEGRYDNTFCFTEHKRHMGMFNGVLTGQCTEIELPTKPFKGVTDLYSDDPHGEIGLCSLASIVLNRTTDEEYADVAYYALLMVDNVIEMMDYPFPSLKTTAQARRSAGIGITNLANDLALNKLRYDTQEAKEYIHYVAERHAYHLYRASLEIGKERGNAKWIDKTKFVDGWLPIDTYKKSIDEIVENNLSFDWESLRKDIVENGGIRNSTVVAIAPNESSSQLTNTTNSVYPIRDFQILKTSSTGNNLFIVPNSMDEDVRPYYITAWDLNSHDLIQVYGILQKFIDQGISNDLYINLRKEGTVSNKRLIQDYLWCRKYGLKARYYMNTRSGMDYDEASGLAIEEAPDCESCTM